MRAGFVLFNSIMRCPVLSNRNKMAIAQYARTNNLLPRLDEVWNVLEHILPHLGEQSHSRQMITRIGTTLLRDEVTIVAPSCPDYSHRNGKYTFDSVGSGVPLLASLHIKLLEKIAHLIPRVKVEILIADQESRDAALCHRIRLSQSDFCSHIERSRDALGEFVHGLGWAAGLMTTRFPDLLLLEAYWLNQIRSDSSLKQAILSDTIARGDMYHRIGVTVDVEMIERTMQTAAQYSALAHIAARDGLLICNHETVNLSWYNRHGAPVLHNAVSIY